MATHTVYMYFITLDFFFLISHDQKKRHNLRRCIKMDGMSPLSLTKNEENIYQTQLLPSRNVDINVKSVKLLSE